jgi:glycolate oxidase FAD binding subunit
MVLSMTGVAGVVSYEPGDRVVTVRSGTPLRSLQDVLAAAGQRLCVESGYDDATVGGVLAAGEAGPLRLRFGSGRDLLIGVEFVRADGVVAHAGGKVVKNVAGYDLGRLLCGSYGTVGVITTATFRLHPLPAAASWVVVRGVSKDAFLTPGALEGVLADIAAVAPSAVEGDLALGQVAVLVEGSVAGVAARVKSVQAVLRDVFAAADIGVAPEPPTWWGRYPFGDGDVGLKIAAPVSLVPAVLTRLGDQAAVRGSIGSGVLHAGVPSTMDASELSLLVGEVRALLAGTGGSCVVVTAPPAVGGGLDRWGEVAGLELMRRLKAQFDPAGRFASGRFVGGM